MHQSGPAEPEGSGPTSEKPLFLRNASIIKLPISYILIPPSPQDFQSSSGAEDETRMYIFMSELAFESPIESVMSLPADCPA